MGSLDHDDLIQVLSEILRERREMLDVSQSDLARRSGLHRSYIGDLERGCRNLSVRNLSRLAEALGLAPSKVLSLAERKMDRDGAAPKAKRKKPGAARKTRAR